MAGAKETLGFRPGFCMSLLFVCCFPLFFFFLSFLGGLFLLFLFFFVLLFFYLFIFFGGGLSCSCCFCVCFVWQKAGFSQVCLLLSFFPDSLALV